jgi:type VI secretion system secreted protein VgrG
MKAKSGKKIEAVKPTKPDGAFVADNANPGTVAKVKAKQIDAKKGKYGQTKIAAFKPKESNAATEDGEEAKNSDKNTNKDKENKEKETTHIAIKLTDEKGNAVVGEKFEIVLPDGSVSKGTLDIDGTAKVEGFEAGPCTVRFPNLENDSVSAK